MRRIKSMKVAKTEDVSRIIEYIKPNIGECIYLYIDLSVYGVNSEYIKVWYDEDEYGLSLIVLKYHNSLQVYTDRVQWDVEGLLNIIRNYDIDIINGKAIIINELEVFGPMSRFSTS